MKNNRCCRKDSKNLVKGNFQFHINFANSVSHELWQHLVIIDNSNKEIFVLEKFHELKNLDKFHGLWYIRVTHQCSAFVDSISAVSLKTHGINSEVGQFIMRARWPYLYHLCTKCMICFFDCFVYIVLGFCHF